MARDPLNVLPEVLLRAARLPDGDAIRVACRARVLALREASATAEAFARAVGGSRRHARRILNAHGVRGYPTHPPREVRADVPEPKPFKEPAHPPASFCSCPSCLRARGRAA